MVSEKQWITSLQSYLHFGSSLVQTIASFTVKGITAANTDLNS